MHSRFRLKGLLLAVLVASLATALLPAPASAGPEPGAPKKKGFRLFARTLGAMTVNRIYCGINADGQVCVDSTNSSTIGGGFWPKGTPDQYVFNSGLQVAGVIGIDGGPWANDTTGGFFFDATGQLPNNEAVQPIYNATSSADLGAWPAAACVPQAATDSAAASVFDLLLQIDSTTGPTGGGSGVPYCRRSASQGDIWFVSWEGNPSFTAGRQHPLGIAVESRGMGWNFPSGNEDILYFIFTFYNVTSTNAADYAEIRPGMRDILLGLATRFQTENAARGSTLPAGGYTINNMFAAFAADMDVSEASANYSSVNLPFALGYIYEESFAGAQGWLFDPSIFGSPFFPGAGFVGVKYLRSPTGPGAIQLFSNTANTPLPPGAIGDPRDIKQLYRYLSGNLSTSAGDAQCSVPGQPSQTHVCYVNVASPGDMRFFQSSTPLTLAPGKAGSIVVAYIFAAPVKTGLCPSLSCANVKPAPTAADVLRLTDPTILVTGANPVDSITGFRGYSDAIAQGGNDDGIVQQNEFRVVPGSLLGKANVAQQVFDNKFLLPFAPDPPDFFLVPGDNQVTVLWRPSPTETSGDPFFQIANAAQVINPVTGLLEDNSLYDPNYRLSDVEGYRVYRGRIDAQNEMTLLAQFDYSGTIMSDYTGVVNPTSTCAPEANLVAGCPDPYPLGGNQKTGTTLTIHTDYDIVDGDPALGDFVQVSVTGASKGRQLLATNEMVTLKADTAVAGGGSNGGCGPKSACPVLDNSGVPFTYVDATPRNGFRYFYSVTAFDVNSFESGPSSLESPRNSKSTTPVRPASNYSSVGQVTSSDIVGRGVVRTGTMPTINATTGIFSGSFPPADGWTIGLGAFVSQVLAQDGNLSATLDSIVLGSAYAAIPHQYWFTATANGQSTSFSIPITQPEEIGVRSGSASFRAVPIDNAQAAQYGGNDQYKLPGQVAMSLPGPDYEGLFGRGCVNGRAGFDTGAGCSYNGSRWFDGPSPANNETVADPIGCNTANFSNAVMTCYNNAGGLTGVTTIYQTQCYQATGGGVCRPLTGILSGVWRAGDFNVYWGAAGVVDSVIDATHNVPVPGPAEGYADHISATWGILNPAAAVAPSPDGSATLTNKDFACVEPIRTFAPGTFTCPAGTPAYTLSATAVPGPVGFFSGGNYPPGVPIVAGASNGFGFYIVGEMFTVELAGGALPAAGTVWTLRKYVGAITGGNGSGGNEGPYAFSNPEGILPLTAIGAEIRANYTVSNTLAGPTASDLKKVHTVPDPYYVTNAFEQSTDNKIIKFVNLPQKAIIRIYSSSGVLVNILEHNSTTFGGEENWNVRNRNNQVVASGVYFYHIESNDVGKSARRVGRMTIVNFAQ